VGTDSYVYVYFRLDGTPCYVGKGKGHRVFDRKNKHFQAILKASNKRLPVVIIRSNLTEQEAFDIEVALIATIGREVDGGPLVNLTLGGEGVSGFKFSDVSKQNLSCIIKSRYENEEYRRNHIQKHIGLKRTKEQVETIKLRMSRPEVKEQQRNLYYSKGLGTPAIIEKRLAATIGSKRTEETKAIMSEKKSAFWIDPEKRFLACSNMRKPRSIEGRERIKIAQQTRRDREREIEAESYAIRAEIEWENAA
jgi:hypothetical protein